MAARYDFASDNVAGAVPEHALRGTVNRFNQQFQIKANGKVSDRSGTVRLRAKTELRRLFFLAGSHQGSNPLQRGRNGGKSGGASRSGLAIRKPVEGYMQVNVGLWLGL